MPKTNTLFWQEKFNKNIQRDASYQHLYREAGWQRLVVWECQLQQHLNAIVHLIRDLHQGVLSSYEIAA
jgi:DNA mismatch endonuclease (patch repair protein)